MNDDTILTAGDERLATLLSALKKGLKDTEELRKSLRPTFGGDRFLTDAEVAENLKLSRRTLQQYRNERKIPYIYFGGKILYRETDLLRMLDNAYQKALP